MDITPRTNTKLFGHDEAEAQLTQGLKNGKLAHGWILAGPRGIGKATLAYRFARELLGHNESARQRILTGSHTDLLVVEPEYDEKKEEYARDISAEQSREIARFLSLTPAEGAWRLVILDGADLLGPSAANSILKILEEPPAQSVILLIAHNPGRLLPTIRSRCQLLRLKPLSDKDFTTAMQYLAPEVEGEELAMLAQLSGHAPGVALEMRGEGAELYDRILELFSRPPDIDAAKLHAFADSIGSGTVHANWQIFTRLMLCLLSRVTRQAAGDTPTPISMEEARILQKLAPLQPAAVWALRWQQCAEQFSLTERLHLDYKQVVIAFFHALMSKEGFQLGNAAA